jgi:hypothetical protein
MTNFKISLHLKTSLPAGCTAFGCALVVLLAVVPVHAGVIATIDFEHIPSLPTKPSTFAAAGPMQIYTSTGVFSISGGVVLGNPSFLASFATHGTPPNAYGTSDLGDVTLLPAITLVLPAAEGITGVTGVLFNGQLFTENYTITALSGAATVASQILNIPNNNSISGFVNFSLSSTTAQPVTQVTITPASNIDVNGWDFFVDTITISSGAAVPEPSSVILVLGGLGTLCCSARRRRCNL